MDIFLFTIFCITSNSDCPSVCSSLCSIELTFLYSRCLEVEQSDQNLNINYPGGFYKGCFPFPADFESVFDSNCQSFQLADLSICPGTCGPFVYFFCVLLVTFAHLTFLLVYRNSLYIKGTNLLV